MVPGVGKDAVAIVGVCFVMAFLFTVRLGDLVTAENGTALVCSAVPGASTLDMFMQVGRLLVTC